MKLTSEECFAKAEAYKECAEHLLLDWTDDELERIAGDKISKTLAKRALHWNALGKKRSKDNTNKKLGEPWKE